MKQSVAGRGGQRHLLPARLGHPPAECHPHWQSVDWPSCPRPTTHNGVTLGQLLNLEESPFPHLHNEHDDAYLAGFIERSGTISTEYRIIAAVPVTVLTPTGGGRGHFRFSSTEVGCCWRGPGQAGWPRQREPPAWA